jgi:CRP-like cAMP-binding protein
VVISARKNLQLSRRSLHTSPKTIRGRLFSYFDKEIAIQKSTQIIIPFNRQQLADYLNLDRSALSKELGRMKKDGLIDYHKNKFIIKKEI